MYAVTVYCTCRVRNKLQTLDHWTHTPCASFISPWSLLRKFELRQHESVQKLTAVLQKQTPPTRLTNTITNTNNRLSMVELLMHDPLRWQWVWSSMMHRCVVESRLGLFSRRNTTSASAPARECVTQWPSMNQSVHRLKFEVKALSSSSLADC